MPAWFQGLRSAPNLLSSPILTVQETAHNFRHRALFFVLRTLSNFLDQMLKWTPFPLKEEDPMGSPSTEWPWEGSASIGLVKG